MIGLLSVALVLAVPITVGMAALVAVLLDLEVN